MGKHPPDGGVTVRGLHKENIIKALPVWTVAVGAAVLFICALVIARRLGDAKPSAPLLASPAGSIPMQEMAPIAPDPADNVTDAAYAPEIQLADAADGAGGAGGFFSTIDLPREAVAVARPATIDGGIVSSTALLARSAARAIAAPAAADAAMIPASAAPADAESTPPRGSDGGETRREDAGRDNVPGTKCGDAVCPPGQVCCNASCGTCTAPGGTCSQQICSMEN